MLTEILKCVRLRTYGSAFFMCIFTVLKVYCDEVQGPIVSVMGTNRTCTSGKEVSSCHSLLMFC